MAFIKYNNSIQIPHDGSHVFEYQADDDLAADVAWTYYQSELARYKMLAELQYKTIEGRKEIPLGRRINILGGK